MQTILKVDGMTCSHCKNAVKNAISAISGVTAVSVDLAEKTVTITHDETVSANIIKTEIEDQGYDIIM